MVVRFFGASVLLSCFIGASSSIVIKHTFYDKVHYFETGPRNYGIVGIGSPEDGITGITVNDDQLVVERNGCDKKVDDWENWDSFLSPMVSYFSNINSGMISSSNSDIVHTISSSGSISGLSMFSYRGFSITVIGRILGISSTSMPMNLVDLVFVDGVMVLVYSDGRLDMSSITCLTEEQRKYVQQLQAVLANRGIVFESTGGLTYDIAQDKVFIARKALNEERSNKLNQLIEELDGKLDELEQTYESRVEQFNRERPANWQEQRRQLKLAMMDEKYRLKDEYRARRSEIKAEYAIKKSDVESSL